MHCQISSRREINYRNTQMSKVRVLQKVFSALSDIQKTTPLGG